MDNVDNFVENYYLQPRAERKMPKNPGKKGQAVKIKGNRAEYLCQRVFHRMSTENPHAFCVEKVQKHVDNVDNYFWRSASPIFITSPAPIVIHKSPCKHVFNKKFSISAKEWK